MYSEMFFGMGLFGLLPLLVVSLLVWLFVSLLKDGKTKYHK